MAESTSPNPASSSAASASSSSWGAFLKSIASFNGDLSSLTAPPFILSATSLTEFSSYWCEHPDLFVAPAQCADGPAQRALLVLRWFLSTLRRQYASRSEQFGNEKKPLNPFLGELFLGRWESPDAGRTDLVSEQVSHHPPATAYCISNRKTGVRLEGYNAQKASFSRTINVRQIGHAVLTIPVPGGAAGETETFLITLPSLHIEGLVFCTPFVELDGTSYITSSTGFTAKVDYSGKGWLSGKKNSITAVLHRAGDERDVLFSAAGQWTGVINFQEGKHGRTVDTLDTNSAGAATTPLVVAPPSEQHPLESRRAWAKVAAAVARGDFDAVGTEKGKIERAQREARAREKAEGRVWDRRYFSAVAAAHGEGDGVLAELGGRVGVPADGDADRTGGLWRYDSAKAARAAEEPCLSADDAAKLERELLGQ